MNESFLRIDVLINTVSFAMTHANPAGTDKADVLHVLRQLDVSVLQAITSGMNRDP